MFSFEFKFYFLLILPVLLFLIVLYFYNSYKNNLSSFSDFKKVYKFNSFYYKLYFIFLFFIFLSFISVFSKPILSEEELEIKKNWVDIQIVLDVSYSMMAEDLKPNRLEVAKSVINDFISKTISDRIWITVFAWKTFLSVPLSFDYNIVKKIVSNISVNTINQNYISMQWTAVWDALILSADNLKDDNDRWKVIILLTDWEANKWINPLVAVDYIKKTDSNIKIYTIWIWWLEDSFVNISDNFWWVQRMEISWVDEKTLKIISNETNWMYFRATDEKSLENIFEEISKLEKWEIIEKKYKINKEFYEYFLYFLIIVFYFILILKFFKRI